MNDKTYVLDFEEDKEPYNLKEVVGKYLNYWPWFLVTFVLCTVMAFAYLKIAPIIYKTEAKIKLLDEAMKPSVVKDVISIANANPNNRLLDIQNQIEVLKSYRLLYNVVDELNLDIEYYNGSSLIYTQIWEPPFIVKKNVSEDRLDKPLRYKVQMGETSFFIKNELTEEKFTVAYNTLHAIMYNLPFTIELPDNINSIEEYRNTDFRVVINSQRRTTLALAKKLNIIIEANSEVLNLSLTGESKERSEAVLNSIINNFNQDGVLDRQLVSKRTLEVIEKRFVNLSQELDSIETGKQGFKQDENISYIEADAGINLQKKSVAESEVIKLNTQVSLTNLLKKTVSSEAEYDLLPADIGLSNSSLNEMVSQYNAMARERKKLITSVGSKHPTLVKISKELELSKLNILSSVNVYESQLDLSLQQMKKEKNITGYRFTRLPETERVLRSIERQQSIKENLYLLLLQKREEANINYGSTAPTIKVIEYGLTKMNPLWPKAVIVYPVSLLMGLMLPFLVLFFKFSNDNVIHSREDVEKINPEIPIVSEIPFFDDNKKFLDINDRSVLAEAFRILGANLSHLLSPLEDQNGNGKVIYVTSSVKAEGKSLLALNLSLAYASISKRVLLVGGDLRNPSLHTYLELDKNSLGLSDYLADPKMDYKEALFEGFNQNPDHKILLSGSIPPNVPVLLSGKRFEHFLQEAKRDYDFIIMDTAPTMLVTDTLLIAKHADITLFAIRAGITDKNVLKFSKELNRTKKLKNLVYVLNGAGEGKAANYNYGYGYGYEMDQPSNGSKKWISKLKESIKNGKGSSKS